MTKAKRGGISKKKVAKKENPKGTCFHCGKDGHWKRNCKAYLDSLKEKKQADASTSGIHMIEINTYSIASKQSWVLDTRCGSHLCNDLQGLRSFRRVRKAEICLQSATGQNISTTVVGTYYLPLPSGLVLELNNCYYVPALSKSIISFSHLMNDYDISLKDKCCYIFKNNMFYAKAIIENGIFVLDLIKEVNNVDTKRMK